jgi:hypothetical protein
MYYNKVYLIYIRMVNPNGYKAMRKEDIKLKAILAMITWIRFQPNCGYLVLFTSDPVVNLSSKKLNCFGLLNTTFREIKIDILQ